MAGFDDRLVVSGQTQSGVLKSPRKSANAGLDFGEVFCQSRVVLSRIYSAAVFGVDAYEVEIEVNAAGGNPEIVIVGLPDTAVKESRDRVTTAISNSGYFWPRGRTTINLAPADIKKEGPSFDLPIALGMIAAAQEIEEELFDDFSFVGELALNGAVRAVKGVLPVALEARRRGKRAIIVPEANAREAAMVEGIDVYGGAESARGFPVRQGRNAIATGARRSERLLRHPPKLRCRFCRRERPGARQARGRSRGRRRAQHSHDRPAGLGQIDALETHRHDHPADGAGGSDRDDEDPQHRGIARRGALLRRDAAVPLAASHHLRRGIVRRLGHPRARRSQPRAQRRPLSRRAAGVQTLHSGSDAPAARRWPGHGFARGRHDDFSVRVHARGGDESLPLRILRRPETRMPLQPGAGATLSPTHFRSVARSHRSAHRSAGGRISRHLERAGGGTIGRDPRSASARRASDNGRVSEPTRKSPATPA